MRKLSYLLTILLSITLTTFAGNKKSLSKEQAQKLSTDVVNNFINANKDEAAKIWKANAIQLNGISPMPFEYTVYGEKPASGRSLYISMHGGGKAPAELNNQQWENQKRLYTPAEGVYVAPRAPWDDWNMWFKPDIDPLFEKLIQTAILTMDVNPNKVYLVGYSAGGDGVYRVAPRMADKWAAASMMAGHPGESSPLNLRNLPFTLWMGSEDAAYNRNQHAIQRGKELDSLHKADPQGYIHETHILQGKGHWMDQVDTAAISWMASRTRNPYPNKVVWRQEQTLRSSFYWLTVPINQCKEGALIRAHIHGNTITIVSNDYTNVTLYLNDQLVNLNKPIKIISNGKTVFKGKIARTAEAITNSFGQRKDPGMIFTAQVGVKL
ncbi:MAG: hypothetical protein ACRDDZ_03790 [Marinifilaceae bacterium]